MLIVHELSCKVLLVEAFVTSGFLPVPAVKGGAVENLVQNLIDVNEEKHYRDFAVFSIYDDVAKEKASGYKFTKFYFYRPSRIIKLLDLLVYFILTQIFKKEKKTTYKFIFQRLFFINYVSKKLKDINFNSVVLENNTSLFLALKWRKNYLKYDGRYFFHLHNDIDKLYGCKNIIENSKKILTISKYIAQKVEDKLNYNPQNVEILMNCIDMNRFCQSYSVDKINHLKDKLKISREDKVIVFVGRTIKEKGILEVIKAFNNNSQNRTLLVIGSAGFDLNIKSDFEKELYLETKKNEKIMFTGHIPYSDVGLYYALADLAVLPSIWEEPAGLTMLEAVASGTPLITTNSGGIPEYVKKFNAIILDVDSDLIENISKSIDKVLNDNEPANRMYSDECRQDFNLEIYLEKFVQCIG